MESDARIHSRSSSSCRESPFPEEVGKLVHEHTIRLATDIWALEEGASIPCAGIEKPVKELGVHGSAADGALI